MSAWMNHLDLQDAEWLPRVAAVAWQWSLLALLVAWPLTLLLRSRAPALRYWVWQIALVKLLIMPIWAWTIPVVWLSASAPPRDRAVREIDVTTSVAPAVVATSVNAASEPPADPGELPPSHVSRATSTAELPASSVEVRPWRAWLLLIWSAVLLLQVGRLLLQRRALVRALACCRPADGAILDEVQAVARRSR